MNKYQLIYYGNPLLRQQSLPVEEITDNIREMVKEMLHIIDTQNGIGLSAVQVGVPLRVFVLRNYIILPDGQWVTSEPFVYINPKIVYKSEETGVDTEGCMSLPGFHKGPVERPLRVTLEAMDLNGKTFTDAREGLNARVTLHENDHLNGVLYIDRLPMRARKQIEPQLRAIKKKFNSQY